MSTKLVELEVVAEVSLAIATRSIKPPLANESTAKAAPLAKTSTIAIEASSSIVRLILPYPSLFVRACSL